MNRKENDVGIKYKSGDSYSSVCPYDVDDVYLTFSETNPATRWPGTTWALVAAGTFLVAGAASGTYKVGNTGGEAAHTLTVSEMPRHRHALTWKLSDYASGNPQSHTSDWNIPSSTMQYTEYEGGGASHNNMPPYIACYMWRRTGGGVSPCSDAVEGGVACRLASTSENSRSKRALTGTASAHGGSATSYALRTGRTLRQIGPEPLGSFTRKTGSSSVPARRTGSVPREGLRPSQSRTTRCRLITISGISEARRKSATVSPALPAASSPASLRRLPAPLSASATREAGNRTRTVLRMSQYTFGGAFHRKAVA